MESNCSMELKSERGQGMEWDGNALKEFLSDYLLSFCFDLGNRSRDGLTTVWGARRLGMST